MIRTAAAVVLAVVAAGLDARAANADGQAEAVVLFDQGIADMRAGRLDKACPELAASLELVKDSGTKGALARCHGLAGRVASAWLLWRELTDTAPTAVLRADAAAQAARLERRLPKYTLTVAAPTPGLVVQINGRTVPINVPIAVPIDPGAVAVTASGRDGDRVITEIWTHGYTAVEGEILAIEIPALAPLARGAAAEPPELSDDRAEARHHRRIVAVVIGGGALGAAGGGAWLGLDARSKYAEARQLCGGAIDRCAADQLAGSQHRVDDARSAATGSTALFSAAGAAAVVSLIVWVTAPSLERSRVVVVPAPGSGAAGLVVSGAF